MTQPILAIGLMSGTSMDGIDASILEMMSDGTIISELGHVFLPYTVEQQLLFKSAEASIRHAEGDLAQAEYDLQKNILNSRTATGVQAITTKTLRSIEQLSTQLHIKAVKALMEQAELTAKDITVIGYHGQTVYHNPAMGKTMTLGDAALMSNELGIPVVHKFREADVAAGGQGAPFAPLYHHAIAMKDGLCPVGIINCGGIANVTIIPSEDEADMIAYDTGPANALIDALVRIKTNGTETYDRDGHYAKQGHVSEEVLALLFEKAVVVNGQNYFDRTPPKSLDTGHMTLLPEVMDMPLTDGCATLAAFTAQSIVRGLELYMTAHVKKDEPNAGPGEGQPTLPSRWILAGGGWKNPVIRGFFDEALTAAIGECTIRTADEQGWNGDAVEANIFAYLAVRSLQGKPLSLPNTTGVPLPQTGGQIAIPHQKAA